MSKLKREAKIRHNTITFIYEKARGIHQLQDDALVNSIILANVKVYKALVHNESSADILYAVAFNKNKDRKRNIKANAHTLNWLWWRVFNSLGQYWITRTIGEPPPPNYQDSKFLGGRAPIDIQCHLKQTNLEHVSSRHLNYHLMIKFPTEVGIRVLSADQEESKRCYTITLKGKMTSIKTYRSCLTQERKKKKVEGFTSRRARHYPVTEMRP